MGQQVTYLGNNTPVGVTDRALDVALSGAARQALADALGAEFVGLGRWTQVGAYIYDADISGATTLTPPAGVNVSSSTLATS